MNIYSIYWQEHYGEGFNAAVVADTEKDAKAMLMLDEGQVKKIKVEKVGTAVEGSTPWVIAQES